MKLHARWYVAVLYAAAFPISSCATHNAIQATVDHLTRAEPTREARYRALIIANSNYANFPALPGTADAEAVKRVLETEYDYKIEPLVLDATADAMRVALEHFGRTLVEKDSVLVYFSGHGKEGGESTGGYWLPVDAEALPETPTEHAAHAAGWVPRSEIVSLIRNWRAPHVLVVDDSCYAGNVKEVDQDLPASAMGLRKPRSIEEDPTRVASRRTRRWLSAGEREYAAAASEDRSTSLFTTHFVEVLQANEGVMDGTELFGIVRSRMTAEDDRQVPDYDKVVRASDRGGDFLFIKRTWSADQINFGWGQVVVRLIGTARDAHSAELHALKVLVIDNLKRPDQQLARRPKAQRLVLTISYAQKNFVTLTLVDRKRYLILGKVGQALSRDSEELAASVSSALRTLFNSAEYELQSREISADVVERAFVAQRIRAWEVGVATGVDAYVDFDGEGLLNKPAWSIRARANRNMTPWLLLGVDLKYQTTKAESSQQLVLGDLDDGTYANNKLVGQLALQMGAATVSATVRRAYGLALPFLYVAAGVAHYSVVLGDERFRPAGDRDSSVISLINRRDDTSSWAFALEAGVGINLLLTEHWSLVGRGDLFKSFHKLKVNSQLEGVSQLKPVTKPFQAIQGVSVQVGISLML